MIRIAVSIVLVFLAVGVAGFATLGLQGKMSRKPPMELFPDMDRQAKLRPMEPNHISRTALARSCRPPERLPAASRLPR